MPNVRRSKERRRPASPRKSTLGVANGQLEDIPIVSKAAAAKTLPHDDPAKEPVALTKEDKRNYEAKLNQIQQSSTGKKTGIVPIWTLDDADGQQKGAALESYETQGRFRKYAEQGTPFRSFSNSSTLATVALCVMDRNGRQTRDHVVERLRQAKPEICPENCRDL